MTKEEPLVFVNSGNFRPIYFVPGIPSSWTQVPPEVQEKAVMNVFQMIASRDAPTEEEVRSAREFYLKALSNGFVT